MRSSIGKKCNGRPLKKAQLEGRTIVFLDESGVTQRPQRCRTWAPKGQTPILQYNFNWNLLSVIAGMTWWNFYFQFCKGSIRGPQVVEFLRHLMRHIHGPIILIWDRLPAHQSGMVQNFIAPQEGRIHTEYVPAYAPDLNPVEYLWG